ncbi:MAG: hypothetical protein CVT99_15490 [Bacteroidetes bacterium HGW-Bacteroidetes-16]|jgi:hypothetical protein|nr:MAG: hypothetical protein CVT99_15490 [Bacteroidetes bacterium HGW-Bacteroidetes-16]
MNNFIINKRLSYCTVRKSGPPVNTPVFCFEMLFTAPPKNAKTTVNIELYGGFHSIALMAGGGRGSTITILSNIR